MKHFRPRYKNIEDWTVLETIVCHAFNEEETPFEALKLKIGVLDTEEISLHNHYYKNTTDIIRWVSRNEYDYLMAHKGEVIW